MAVTLDEVKDYLRIDGDIEDSLLNRLILTAEAYLEGAVDSYVDNLSNSKFKVKAEMVVLAIISDLYENRNQGGADSKQYGRAIESLVRQLQNFPG